MAQLIFSLTLFISAALLFWIQLLTAKMILPVLGGSASVWNTCMMFFQITLLLGYLYACGRSHASPGGASLSSTRSNASLTVRYANGSDRHSGEMCCGRPF